MEKAKSGRRKLDELVKQRKALEAQLAEETLINEKVTENLERVQRQRREEKKEISALTKRIEGMEKCRQYSAYRKFGLATEMMRKKRIVEQFKGIQGPLFDHAKKAAEIDAFNKDFAKQLREAPWLPEKRAILDELKKEEAELAKVQKEIAETDATIAERTALLEQHKETPFKTFCLALANYSSKAHTFVKTMDKEFVNAAKLEAKMAALQLKNRTRQAPKPMLEGRSAVQTPLLEDRSAAETPMLEDRSATETPMPDEERIAEQPLLEEGRNRNAKEPPESGIAAKRVRFETIASPDSGSTASYPPYPVHKHIRHQEQQKEADAIVSKNGGFGNFFTSPPAPVGGRGPTKEQQQKNGKKAIGDTSKNAGGFSTSFLDLNSDQPQDVTLPNNGGFLGDLFGTGAGDGGGPSKEQSFHFGFGAGESSNKDQSFQFNFGPTNDNAGGSDANNASYYPFKF